MAMGDFWTADEDRELTELRNSGYTDNQIAEILARTPHAVGARRSYLGLTNSPHARAMELAPVMFPRFENVTKDECRKITATTPPSGKFSRQPHTSGMTSCAVMMVEA